MPITLPSDLASGALVTEAEWDKHTNAIIEIAGYRHNGDTLENAPTSTYLGPDVGDMKPSFRSTSIDNAWMLCAGGTVGDGSSGSSLRANDDMEDLFTHIWTEGTNTTNPIYDSGGGASTRGASAAADWAAHKRISLPDMRGRVIAGMDNPGGGAANRITNAQADTLGGVMGAEDVTLSESQIPSHDHDINYDATGATGGGLSRITGITNSNGAGSTFASLTAGGGGSHTNVQPVIFMNWFIYSGN